MAEEETAEQNTSKSNDTEVDETKKPKKLNQLYGALVAMLGGYSLGLAIGWSSPAQDTVGGMNESGKKKNDAEKILNHYFWIASILAVGAMSVMLPVAFVLDHVGRKISMLVLAPILSISFILVAVSFNVYVWIVARFIMGFSSAAFCVAAPIYVGEIAEHDIRGTLGVFFQLLLTIGIATEYTLGLADNYMVLGYVSSVFPMIFFVLFFFLPDSPLFLLMRGRTESAIKSLQFYRGKNYDITQEMQELESSVEEMKSTEVSYKDLVRTVSVRKSLIIALGAMVFQQVSGINVVMFYSATLFKSTGSSLTPVQSSIVLAIVQVLGTAVSSVMVDKLGRKLLLYISQTGMAVCLCALGGWFIYLDSTEDVNESLKIVPIVILCLYLLFFSFGAGPIPWTMIGEIFPKELKGMCGSIAGFVNWLFAFIITVTFNKYSSATPSYVPFFIYAIFCCIANVFVFFIMIETKGKTLQEIEKELAG